mgnify:FL=1
MTQSSIGLPALPGWMCGRSSIRVGQGIIKLLMRNDEPTDGCTDMCKALCPLFIERRGIINMKQLQSTSTDVPTLMAVR